MAAKKRHKRGYALKRALKLIESGDLLEIRRRLHAGGEPMRDSIAQLFMRWRRWCVLRDDSEKRLKRKGDKWGRKALQRCEREIAQAWRDLGVALSATRMSDEKLNEQMTALRKASRAVYAWQKAATEIVVAQQATDNVRLSEDKVEREIAQWLLADVRRVNLTRAQVTKHLSEQGHSITPHTVGAFVRNRLKITLRGERGKRTDLKPRWKRHF